MELNRPEWLDTSSEVMPDYAGGSLVNLMQSIAQAFDVGANEYSPLRLLQNTPSLHGSRNIVLWVIDGLGYEYISRQGADWPLHQYMHGAMTSVFPSTTASAIPTFLSGQAPQQHGLTGWHVYLRELGQIASVLPFRSRVGGSDYTHSGVDAVQLYRPRPFFDLLPVVSHVVAPTYIAHSPFNNAFSGAANIHPYSSMNDMLAQISASVRTDAMRNYVYAYWPEYDRRAHEFGVRSEAVQHHYEELNAAFLSLQRQLAGTDTLLLVTADHGFIDVEQDREIRLSQHPVLEDCLRLPLSGERRVAYCYLKPGMEAIFLDYVQTTFGEAVTAVPSPSLIEAGWFGHGHPHPRLLERIGDYTLLLHGRHTIKDWLPGERPFWQRGVHGGIDADEMRVPLIALAC